MNAMQQGGRDSPPLSIGDEFDEPEPLIPGQSVSVLVRSAQADIWSLEASLENSPPQYCDDDDDDLVNGDLNNSAYQAPPAKASPRTNAHRMGKEEVAKDNSFPLLKDVPSKNMLQQPLKIEQNELHMAVWLAEARRLQKLLEASADVNAIDSHGSSPLMLAVELLPRAQEYEKIVELLLQHDADPRQRSSQGWSPIDIAVSRGDKALVQLLFDHAKRNLNMRWQSRLAPVVDALRHLPDFECRIRWEFESPVPLVGRIAPSDILIIRKRGASLRLDSTLASWKRFRLSGSWSKRRELTTLFQGGTEDSNTAGGTGSCGSIPRLFMVNHSKQVAVDMTAEPDGHENDALIEDLVAADAMQWDMSVGGLEVSESTGWLGHSLGPCEVNGWNTTRFDVKGSVGVTVQKKGSKTQGVTYQEYFGRPLPPDACLPELQEEFRRGLAADLRRPPDIKEETDAVGLLCSRQALMEDLAEIDAISDSSEILAEWPNPSPGALEASDSRDCDALHSSLNAEASAFPMARKSDPVALLGRSQGAAAGGKSAAKPATDIIGESSRVGANASSRDTKKKECDQIGKTSRNVSASVWLTNDFAISLQQFLPVLEAFSSEHEAMRRLRDLLGSQSVTDAAERARTRCQPSADTGSAGGTGGAYDTKGGTNVGHVFPVKVSVPVNLALRALAHFEFFELRPSGQLPASLFEVPASYHWVHRCEAQKTLKRRTKRAFLAHLVSA